MKMQLVLIDSNKLTNTDLFLLTDHLQSALAIYSRCAIRVRLGLKLGRRGKFEFVFINIAATTAPLFYCFSLLVVSH